MDALTELPPGPSLTPIEQTFHYVRRPFAFLHECVDKFGRIFTLQFPGFPPSVVVWKSEDVKQIFSATDKQLHTGESSRMFMQHLMGKSSILTTDGEIHLRKRKILLPLLQGKAIEDYAEKIAGTVRKDLHKWPRNQIISLEDYFKTAFIRINLELIFSAQSSAEIDELAAMLDPILNYFFVSSKEIFFGLLNPPKIPVAVQDELTNLDNWLAAREAHFQVPVGKEPKNLSQAIWLTSTDTNHKTDPLRLREAFITIIFSSFETTSIAALWMMYDFLRLADVKKKLLEDFNREFNPQKKYHYLQLAMEESLRLHPLFNLLFRMVKQPITLAGYQIPADNLVCPSIYLTHHDPAIWEDPFEFKLERFKDRVYNPFEYYPFGGGIRRCVGMSLGMLEIKVFLGILLTEFNIALAPEYKAKPLRHGLVIGPSKGLPAIIQ